ncbi:hypothetical protein FB567DRAFT_516651 [Paraphoma chrysanthemicola]|uniref:Zn(2)-C6 fungal-type domain-containing protein n=1 Tax=Paraphoma chrysanthemicola TaxID=798071 RepID=A0A8K0RG63_9PLEO|nr:hypothetical protein FB567DRAFT_516651 [Paraphoma chrysanthemicola]
MDANHAAFTAPGPREPQDAPASPTVACLRCRDQKLRCGRELPSCERCRKQKAACTYPSPPDRKRIAQRTNRLRASQPLTVEERGDLPASLPSPFALSSRAVHTAKKRRLVERPNCQEQSGAEFDQSDLAELPSTEVGLLLLEVYFKRVYNATLLFHKHIAFQVYMQNGTPDYLLRAIFAHAAIFLKEVEDLQHRKHIKTTSMQSLHSRSWSWARSASTEVLAHADEPSLMRIQALQVLQLYYFSQGEINRAIVHASLAYRLSQLLGYDKLYEEATSRGMQFDREMRRRSFWASWCSFIIGSSQLDPCRIFARVANLPLPAKFGRGGSIQGVELMQGERMDRNWKSNIEFSADHEISTSLMAELVKLLGVWTKVQAFEARIASLSVLQQQNEVKTIDELFDPIELAMDIPIADLCSRAEVYEESPELLASICSMAHLSRLLLHASMVPLLSGHHTQSAMLQESMQAHTSMVIHQAMAYIKLLQQFIARNLDITRLWPITGYGAFTIGIVFVVLKNVSQSSWPVGEMAEIPGLDSEEMKVVQLVLDVLSIYWQPLRKLADKLNNAVASGQLSGLSLVTLSAYSGYSVDEHDDRGCAAKSPGKPNLFMATPDFQASPQGQLNQDHSTGGQQTQTLRHRVPAQTRAAMETSIAEAVGAEQEFASFDYALTNGHKEGILDMGWWNNCFAMHALDYTVADMAGSVIMPLDT